VDFSCHSSSLVSGQLCIERLITKPLTPKLGSIVRLLLPPRFGFFCGANLDRDGVHLVILRAWAAVLLASAIGFGIFYLSRH
jgi:hypothetical protein